MPRPLPLSVMRLPGLIIIVSALASGSVAVASMSVIDAPAGVERQARRLAPPFRPEQTSAERAEAVMIDLVNDERARRGLPSMRPNALVTAAATAHAADMASVPYFGHIAPDGSDTSDRLEREGFAWRTWGEAIGAGYITPEPLFDAWMNSPDHRAHILSANPYIGVGVVATPDGVPYWVLVVAT